MTVAPSQAARARDASGGRPRRDGRPGVLGALALAAEIVGDELVVGTARDVHEAVASRVYGAVNRATCGAARVPQAAHDRVARHVFGGVRMGLRGTSRALRAADGRVGGAIEDSPQGRFLVAAVNGLIGDRLAEQHPELAISMAVRRDGADVPLDPDAIRTAFPDATGDVVIFLHGLSESEDVWNRRHEETTGSYGDSLAADTSWTPVFLRANTGLPIADNGVALASLLDRLVAAWPVEVERVALVGHSMGGLIMRAACAVELASDQLWRDLVTNVVTLGTPHLGAPIERGLVLGVAALGRVPEAAPFGRILEYRSVGILDLRAGLAQDVQNLPHARYHLVAATLAASPRHPVSELFGDMLVRYPSALGRPRRGRAMFPDADVLHVRGGHFDLLNHPDVHAALRRWLS